MSNTPAKAPGRMLRLSGVNTVTVREIQAIASRTGVSASSMLAKDLETFVASFPQALRERSAPCYPSECFRIIGMSEETKEAIENIAYNLAVSVSDLVKPRLQVFAAGYPAFMKTKRVEL